MESEIRHCRLCFGEEISEHSIFNMVDDNGISLSTKIILCTSLMVSQEDFYSEYICNNCIEMVELFYEFRNTCLNTHISVHNLVNGFSQFKEFSEQDKENNDDNEILSTSAEVEIISEKSNNGNLIEIKSVNIEGCSSSYLNESHIQEELDEQIVCSEDSSRQFQVGCYMSVSDEENSQCNNKVSGLLLRRFKCMNCKNVFSSLNALDSHWEVCTTITADSKITSINNQDFRYSCKSGGIKYDESAGAEVVREEQIIEREEYKTRKHSSGREFCCETCGQVFKQLLLLKRHIQVKHICVRPYGCTQCPKKFFDKYELKYHQRLHEDVEDFCCSICKRRFARRSGLKSHMRSHTGEKPFACKVCNKSFSHLNSLLAHERVHTGERPYYCQYCLRTFAQYSTAKSHEEMHMGGLRMFQCEICDRMFKSESDLSSHRSTHDGLHGFKCLLCDKGFKKQSELNKHNQRYHCDNKPYPCNRCSKSYVTLRELQLHATLHTGELPYPCLICSKSYRLSSTLRRHMYKHHTNSVDTSTFEVGGAIKT